MKKIVTKNSQGTEELGKKFAKSLKPGDILCLEGDLGGGKTTFTKGIAKGLGIKRRITSPTFVLIKKYKIPKTHITYHLSLIQYLHHIDLYRLKRIEDILALGFEEVLQDKNSIIIIEWAEKVEKFLTKKRKKVVKFDFIDENTRKITIK